MRRRDGRNEKTGILNNSYKSLDEDRSEKYPFRPTRCPHQKIVNQERTSNYTFARRSYTKDQKRNLGVSKGAVELIGRIIEKRHTKDQWRK
ncbi:MAG: hypothetical protein ACFFC7_14500 [Candidatus Hermodarchaeota archaeon]